LPIRASETLEITFAGDTDLRERLRQFFGGQRVRFAMLVESLVARHYLDSPADARPLKIRPWIDDERNAERTQLPDVSVLLGDLPEHPQ